MKTDQIETILSTLEVIEHQFKVYQSDKSKKSADKMHDLFKESFTAIEEADAIDQDMQLIRTSNLN